MNIILTEKDIEDLIKKFYLGVNSVKFSRKNIKVTLDVTSELFMKPKGPFVTTSISVKPDEPIEPIRQESLVETAREKGLMSPGGESRTMMTF